MIGGVAAGTLGYTGVGGGDNNAPEIDRTATPEETPSGIVRYERPEQVLDPARQYFATLQTDQGDIRVELFVLFNDGVRGATNSFVFLAQQDFYDGLEFFFVRQGFVAQAGDPTCNSAAGLDCTGSGGPGYTLPVEADDRSHESGALVLPAIIEGQEVNGSQFRILLADDRRLDSKETVFGRVVSGMELLNALPDRLPCFGQEPSDAYPCQIEPPTPLIIQDVVIEAV